MIRQQYWSRLWPYKGCDAAADDDKDDDYDDDYYGDFET